VGGVGRSFQKIKPSFPGMHWVSDPAFPQSPVPLAALVFP